MSTHDYQLFVDGKWVPGGGATTTVRNPATGEIVGTVPEATVPDVDLAVSAARRAFDEGPWGRTSPRERAEAMIRMADALDRRAPLLRELSTREAGSTLALAQTLQVGMALHHFRDMAERVLPQFVFDRPLAPTVGPGLAQGVAAREPIGVAALISPYNFPLLLTLVKLAPALAAGCTAVLKPAPATPLETYVVAEAAAEAGLPPGVVNVITGGNDVGAALTSHPGVDMVSFTGSDAVGRLVYAQAAPTLKRVVLELGGKSANIITEDADLSLVVPSVVANMVTHAGQGCSLLTRTLVSRTRLEELVERVTAALERVTVGDPADPATVMGPLISEAQRAKVERLVETGRSEGARVAFGGGRPAGLEAGHFVEPTLFVDVENSMTVAREEFFGPVGVVIAFEDDDDAVRLANDSPYGLGGGVWSADPVRAYALARRLRTGMVYVNGGGAGSSPHTPFGGYKQSGLGLERGEVGLEEFLLSKSIIWSAR